MTETADWNVCIDFGTAFSKAAAAPASAWERFDPRYVRPLPLAGLNSADRNPFLLTSAIFVGAERIFFDRYAIEQSVQAEDNRRQALSSFKILLGAGDLDRALNTIAPATIDPHRMFRQRHLVVLYLAYLLRALDAAVAQDPVIAANAGAVRRRYACPSWGAEFKNHSHQVVVRLFDEAEHVRKVLGDELETAGGVPIQKAMDALQSAAASPPPPNPTVTAMIYEAVAATASCSIGIESAARHLIVLDVGAGTTDIAALARLDDGLVEIPEARVTLNHAGDYIDQTLLNLIIERIPGANSTAEKARLWRNMTRTIRRLKESLFTDKQAAVQHEGRVFVLKQNDLQRNRDYRHFVSEITDAYQTSLRTLAARAVADGQSNINVIAAGGGASSWFVKDVLSKTSIRTGKVRVSQLSSIPDWAHAPEFGANLAPLFPQLVIAIGGALAPGRLLAIR